MPKSADERLTIEAQRIEQRKHFTSRIRMM